MNLKELDRLFVCGREIVFRANNDNRLTVTEITESVTSIVGYTSKDFLSGKMAFDDLLHPDDEDTFTEYINSDTSNIEKCFRIFSKCGEMLWISCICISNEKKTDFLIKLRDITEQKRS